MYNQFSRFLLIGLFFTLTVSVSCFGQPYSQNWLNLEYGDDTLTAHKMDLYLPKTNQPIHPVVVLVYGSAWFSNNSKNEAYNILGPILLDSGFAVATINHRSSHEAIFPAQINDIKAAIRFLRANASRYKLDSSFIGITGYSSGGHLSALAGSSGGIGMYTVDLTSANLEGNVGRYPHYSSHIDAVVDWFGPTDFLVMDSCGSSFSHNASDSPESSLIGVPIQSNPDKVALANPITFVNAGDPPFLIFHGDEDPLVPYCESKLLYEALQRMRVPAEFVLVPKGKHGPGVFEPKYLKQMAEFFIGRAKEKNAFKSSM